MPELFSLQATPDAAAFSEWLIDVGSFKDRFGALKMAVLTSADGGIKAILQDMSGRPWIDLRNPEVASSLAYVGSVIPQVDAALQARIMGTPATAYESLALRKLYFS